MRKQLHLKTTRVVVSYSPPPTSFTSFFHLLFFFSPCQIRKYKLQNEKLTEEMEERIENKNETIVDLHIQVQCMKKEVEQFALKEKAIQSQKEQLTQEITAMNASLQNQVYENAIQANQLADLQQQLDQKEETIAYMLDYRQNLEDNYLTIQEKMDLLDHEMDQMVQERNLMLHYVVTMQACLYNDVEQWLNQLLEYDHISEGSMHKFKSVREQVNLLKPILARNRAGVKT
ncbi:A-kinase anchor protein 9-like isoform X2 [Takifugu flavidus]|uniref:A-kinase anchor protein 9-like isoform X2 n=1 Tax=Takifugu flavidus TaxID=433684 RepID=UPI0025449359|nr:A-kinase anchor protein 9-like isoform X2 [Takifugu flavidus]XP_056885480.1 A-kinase anchor protein 9-like isoform X2 [Takifugu flavidus]